jgi:hypothetical protein
MTTKVLPFTPQRTRPSSALWRWIFTGEGPVPGPPYLARRSPEQIWAAHGERVLAHYVLRHPGCRPWLWWKIGECEPRTRLGGIGDPLDTCSAVYEKPYDHGVPWSWRREGDPFTHGTPISDIDPPRFESEAAYLLRLGLLEPGERERIAPEDFEPEVIRYVDGYIDLGPIGG